MKENHFIFNLFLLQTYANNTSLYVYLCYVYKYVCLAGGLYYINKSLNLEYVHFTLFVSNTSTNKTFTCICNEYALRLITVSKSTLHKASVGVTYLKYIYM